MIIKSDYIRNQLSYIKSKIQDDTKQKLYDINKTSEDIFMHILNDVYGWKLVNANDIKPNFPAIDLIDTTNKIVIQVTSSMDDAKVISSIAKFTKFSDDEYKDGAYKQYAHYQLKMFYIKAKPEKFSKVTQIKIDNQNMSDDDFLGIEDINTKVSANPDIATKVFKTLCKILHNKVCDSNISPQLTTKLGKSIIIGREKELQEIDEQLNVSNTLLVKGIGGVGKSTIASNYLHRHKDEYDYYSFFEGLESFETELEGAFKLEPEQGQNRFDRILRELIKLDGNKLLVIDDIKEIKENQEKLEKILGLEYNGYRVLLTSRFKVKNVEIYPLPSLDPLDAQKLFLDNYKTEELEKVNQITEYLDYHPLFVELVAKSIENEGYSLDEMIEKFECGELAKIVFIDEEEGDETSFNKNLQKLFEMQKNSLGAEYFLLLKQLAVLPSIDIELNFLEEIFNRNLKSRLNFLVDKGWIIESANGYKLHQIIKEFLLANDAPNFEEIEVVFDYFDEMIFFTGDQTYAVSLYPYLIYLDYLYKVLKTFKKNEVIAIFIDKVANIYYYLLFYEKALELHLAALEIKKSIFIQTEDWTFLLSSSYHNIAGVYLKLERFEEALELFNKELKKDIKVFGIDSLFTSLTYHNIARVYHAKENFKQAIYFYKKSIKVSNKIFENSNPEVLKSYSNLATILVQLGKNKDALDIYLSLEDKFKNVYGTNKLEIATLYKSIAINYTLLKRIKIAYQYIQDTCNIQENILPKEHPELIDSYKMLNNLKANVKKKDIMEFQKKEARNSLCSCGSGKKYKKCCGKSK